MTKKIYIGFDRDGTLFMPGLPTPDLLIRQFKSLQDQGIILFLASGKSHAQLVEICEEIQLDPWLIAAENGAHILIPSQKYEHVGGRDHADLQFFIQSLNLIDLPPHGPEPKLSIWSKKFHEHAEQAGEVLRQFIELHQLKLDVFVYPDGCGGVDVVPQGIDKMMLLEHIPEDAEIHFFGDGENDLGMMEHARVIPHTMANGKEVVKNLVQAKGGRVADQPAGLGVASLLNQLFKV